MEVNSKQSTSSRILIDITIFALRTLLIIARNLYSCSLHDLFCQSMKEYINNFALRRLRIIAKNCTLVVFNDPFSLSMKERSYTLFYFISLISINDQRSYTLKIFRFYTITSSFEDKANHSNIDIEYPVKFRYFTELCH